MRGVLKIKKLYCLAALFGIAFFAFPGNFFSTRFFEMQVSAPFDFSNNVFSLNQILQKEVTVDLTKIAESTPNDGLIFVAKAKPEFGFNLNAGPVSAGLRAGFDIYEKMGISKDLFDFLGKGNEIGEEINVELKNNTDVFFENRLDLGIRFKKFSVKVSPSVFLPILSVQGSLLKTTFVNSDDGAVKINLSSNPTVYTNFSIDNTQLQDMNSFEEAFNSCLGFDLGGRLELPFKKDLVVAADARVPLVPGSYKYYIPDFKFEKGFEIKASALGGGAQDSQDGSNQMITQTGDENFNMPNKTALLSEKVYIHRPLKFHAYVIHTPFKLLELCAGAGLGVFHPFMNDAFAYPEYYLSAGVNFFDFLKAKLSTEYTDQIFKHQIAAGVNIRLIELECGVSLQSTTFTKSMEVTGVGGYAVVSVGF